MITNATKDRIERLKKESDITVSKFMTDVLDMLSVTFDGLHHTTLDECIKKEDYCGTRDFTYYHKNGNIATYDYNQLSKLVILAHLKGIRVSVKNKRYCLEINFGNVRKWKGRKHTTINNQIKYVKSYYIQKDVKGGLQNGNKQG